MMNSPPGPKAQSTTTCQQISLAIPEGNFDPLQQQGESNDIGFYMTKHFQAHVGLARIGGMQREAKLRPAAPDTGVEKGQLKTSGVPELKVVCLRHRWPVLRPCRVRQCQEGMTRANSRRMFIHKNT